ncbi:MAG: OmpA family protein [Myxococcales bacterium]|jgi:peptidoglycan-associated lipoprotein|nr:OmpA family protein [Myxococcales bacterium]
MNRGFGLLLCVALSSVGFSSGCAVARVTVESGGAVRTPVAANEANQHQGPRQAPSQQQVPVVMQLAFAPQENEVARAQREIDEATRALEGTALFFETDKSDLSKEGKVKLYRVAQILRRYPDFRIRIEGHADARGTVAYNDELGQKRACNARDYLLSLQVDALQVSCMSFGKQQPLAPGNTAADYQLNRRNDIVPAQGRK